jgi:DNA-binding MarR family transcriptional regulator
MFTECYCTQFRRSANALTHIYDNALRPAGLKITQHSLLRALARLEAATYNEIAAEVDLDKTTISRNLKVLIEAGWVEASSDDDARYKVAKLSALGIKKLRDAEPYWRDAQQQVEREMKKYLKGPAKAVLLEALETLQGFEGTAEA